MSNAPTIDVYSSDLCPYCYRAKALLNHYGVAFNEIKVDFEPAVRAEMRQRAGGQNSVPQIFFGDRHIGGCDDLYALEAAGKLAPMIADLSPS